MEILRLLGDEEEEEGKVGATTQFVKIQNLKGNCVNVCVESDVITDRGGRCEHNNKDFPYLAKQVYRVISTVTVSASQIKR